MIRGRFITLEGGDGAGKTTQIEALQSALEEKGLAVVVTREPGGSAGAEEIRNLLLHGHEYHWDGLTEALLNYAARRDHVLKTIEPALADGAWVISDRFFDSTTAYQGVGHGVAGEALDALRKAAIGDFAPDLTLILDLPVDVGQGRVQTRGGTKDRFELLDREFHERLRQAFLDIAAAEPERCRVIDATPDSRTVSDALWAAVRAHFDELT